MTNILEAIVNIANNPNFNIKNQNLGRNRTNNVGEPESVIINSPANIPHKFHQYSLNNRTIFD